MALRDSSKALGYRLLYRSLHSISERFVHPTQRSMLHLYGGLHSQASFEVALSSEVSRQLADTSMTTFRRSSRGGQNVKAGRATFESIIDGGGTVPTPDRRREIGQFAKEVLPRWWSRIWSASDEVLEDVRNGILFRDAMQIDRLASGTMKDKSKLDLRSRDGKRREVIARIPSRLGQYGHQWPNWAYVDHRGNWNLHGAGESLRIAGVALAAEWRPEFPVAILRVLTDFSEVSIFVDGQALSAQYSEYGTADRPPFVFRAAPETAEFWNANAVRMAGDAGARDALELLAGQAPTISAEEWPTQFPAAPSVIVPQVKYHTPHPSMDRRDWINMQLEILIDDVNRQVDAIKEWVKKANAIRFNILAEPTTIDAALARMTEERKRTAIPYMMPFYEEPKKGEE